MMIIFPVAREKALRQTLAAQGFGVVWVRFVHTTANTPPKRILVCAAKNRPGPGRVRPPLFLTDPCTAFKIGAV
jgi:tRNA1(Val) A37 N6-methylase TrmN6